MSETVILTYGRSLMSVVAARSLAQRDVNIIGVDSVDYTALRFSRHCARYELSPDAGDEPELYVDFLAQLPQDVAAETGAPVVLMPMFRDARLVAAHRDRFDAQVHLTVPDRASIEAVHPKDQFQRFCDEAGLPVPDTTIVASPDALDPDALDNALTDCTVPCVVKPADGVGGRGIAFCDTVDEVRAHAADLLKRGDTVLLQAPVPGDDYCVTFLGDDGALAAISAYTNLSTFPKDGGAGAVRKTVDHAPFEEAARRFVAATGWSGVGEIDFRWDGDDASTPQMIEVNPRFWAGLFHSIASGIDFPWLAYCQALGRPLDPADIAPEIGHVTRTPLLWAASAVADVAHDGFDADKMQSVLDASGDAVKKGKLVEAINRLKDGIGDALSFDDAMFSLAQSLDDAAGAKDELSDPDDPFVGLGALFIASSLIRQRKLPDEVKF